MTVVSFEIRAENGELQVPNLVWRPEMTAAYRESYAFFTFTAALPFDINTFLHKNHYENVFFFFRVHLEGFAQQSASFQFKTPASCWKREMKKKS